MSIVTYRIVQCGLLSVKIETDKNATYLSRTRLWNSFSRSLWMKPTGTGNLESRRPTEKSYSLYNQIECVSKRGEEVVMPSSWTAEIPDHYLDVSRDRQPLQRWGGAKVSIIAGVCSCVHLGEGTHTHMHAASRTIYRAATHTISHTKNADKPRNTWQVQAWSAARHAILTRDLILKSELCAWGSKC